MEPTQFGRSRLRDLGLPEPKISGGSADPVFVLNRVKRSGSGEKSPGLSKIRSESGTLPVSYHNLTRNDYDDVYIAGLPEDYRYVLGMSTKRKRLKS